MSTYQSQQALRLPHSTTAAEEAHQHHQTPGRNEDINPCAGHKDKATVNKSHDR